jgi:HD-like signal output (HDOD) protein
MITSPLPDLAAWVAILSELEIPILRQSADAIAEMIEDDDRASGVAIGRLAQHDPLLTLRILVLAARHRSSRAVTDTETAVTGVVMMGLSRFFADFHAPVVVEDLLVDDPVALAGLSEVIRRAHRAAFFALGFAVHRLDTDAEVIQEAAMLHDFAEMLMWCHAPRLARRMLQRLVEDQTMRSSLVQMEVFNVKLHELQRALMRAWGLPGLLDEITDRSRMESTRVRNVVLAVDLARHTQHGWGNAAIPDDLQAIAELLNMSTEGAHQKVLSLDS